MALQFVNENLREDINKIDILGAKGCRYAPPRCNLLLEVKERILFEDELILGIQRYSPAGFGAEYFLIDLMEIPTEEIIPGRDQLIWDINGTIPPLGCKLWFCDVLEVNTVRGMWDLAFCYDAKSTWKCAPQPELDGKPLRCLELFAGAYGGWKGALELLSQHQVYSQTVGIEIDERASKAYALTHYANWIGPNVDLPTDWFVTNHDNWIWQQDVLSEKILKPLLFWQPHVITISSPCPDWSSAGYAHGLLRPGAKLLFQTILLCRWFRPMYIALEQVSNFHAHEHKHWIMKALHMVGYRMVWQKVCNLTMHAQTARSRWLGLAGRTAECAPTLPFTMWPYRDVNWPDCTLPFKHADKQSLFLNADIVELASSAAYLKTSLPVLPSTEVIFEKRTYQPSDVFPTFMAMYGQQHHMNREYLKKHGYLGHFVHDSEAPFKRRFLHPAEVALLHGSINKVYLDGNLNHAWHHLGNMIAVPHALLVLGNLTKTLGLLSEDIEDLFGSFHETKLTAENSFFRKIGTGGFLMRKNQLLTHDFLQHAKSLEQSLHKDQCQLWSPAYGIFKEHGEFSKTKARKITKDFVLKVVQPGSMQTHRIDDARASSSDLSPAVASMHPMPILNDMQPVEYPLRPDGNSTEGFPQHASVMSTSDQKGRISELHQATSCSIPEVVPPVVATNALQPAVYRSNISRLAREDASEDTHWFGDVSGAVLATASTHVPHPPFHAMPLPRLGCGGPSHGETDQTSMNAPLEHAHDHALEEWHPGKPSQYDLTAEPAGPCAIGHHARTHVQTQVKVTAQQQVQHDHTAVRMDEMKPHVPPTHFQAMPLPRLGCGGPSQCAIINAFTADPNGQPMCEDRQGPRDLLQPIEHTEAPRNTRQTRSDICVQSTMGSLGEFSSDQDSKLEHAEPGELATRAQQKTAYDPSQSHHAMPLPRLGCGGPSFPHDHSKEHTIGSLGCQALPADESNFGTDTKINSEDVKSQPHAAQHFSGFADGVTSAQFGDQDMTTAIDATPGNEYQVKREEDANSPITVTSDSQSIPDTIQFQPVLKGIIQWKQYQETFWFAADLPATNLERVWELGDCCVFMDLQDPSAACLKPTEVNQDDKDQVATPRTCVSVLMDGELSLLKVQSMQPLLQQQHILSLACTMFDQFGPLTEGQTTDFGTTLLTEPLTHGINTRELVYVIAAFAQTNMTWHVCKVTNVITASFAGNSTAVTFLQQFFLQALTTSALTILGRKVSLTDCGELVFSPMRTAGVVPPNPFLIALAIAATRTLLDCLETEADDTQGRLITIKWAGRPLWKGHIQTSTSLATIECILRNCFVPWGSTSAFRLVHRGAQVPLEHMVSQLQKDDSREDILIHAIMALRGGGNGTKMQQRAVQQNALASTLLDHGFNLAWTTKTVEAIMEKYGLGKLQAVNSQPMGNAKIQAILALCKEAGVVIPDITKPKSGNEIPGPIGPKRKKRTPDLRLNPADYTLVEGFFTKEDGSDMAQVSQIVPQACGICIQTAAQAEVWVREGQTISVDELGLLVLGPMTVPTGLTSEEITFPSYNSDKQMVLITATLVQLGAKSVKHRQGDPQQVPSESCSLVAVTMYKEDWTEDDWRAITINPTSVVRKQLEAEGMVQGIQAIWGKSLRHQRSPATPVQALTVQVHMTVEDTMMERLLARSGFNRLFLTPKTQVGRLNSTYKVIWIPGDIPKLTSLTTKCQSCVGLVRGRQGKGYGLRFHADKYDAAWAVLMPGTSPPMNNPGDKVYKLQNLPFGCTKVMLQNWAKAMNWDACPIRALGPQTWIVRASQEIPPGIPMFNSSPILARLLPPRDQQGPDKILLGPRPKPQTGQQGDPWHQGQDPWANYGPNRAGAPTSSIAMPPQQGPMEKRFLEQDAKIAHLQAGLDQLTQAQQHQAKHVESQFKQAANREQENMTKMDKALKHIEQSLDNAMTKSMHQYQAAMDQKF